MGFSFQGRDLREIKISVTLNRVCLPLLLEVDLFERNSWVIYVL